MRYNAGVVSCARFLPCSHQMGHVRSILMYREARRSVDFLMIRKNKHYRNMTFVPYFTRG